MPKRYLTPEGQQETFVTTDVHALSTMRFESTFLNQDLPKQKVIM